MLLYLGEIFRGDESRCLPITFKWFKEKKLYVFCEYVCAGTEKERAKCEQWMNPGKEYMGVCYCNSSIDLTFLKIKSWGR